MKPTIEYEEFLKLDIRIGTVIDAQAVPNTDKLLKVTFSLGDEERQIVAGMAEFYTPEDLIGKQLPLVLNLRPKVFRGAESQGMILAADVDKAPVFLLPEKKIPSGSEVR